MTTVLKAGLLFQANGQPQPNGMVIVDGKYITAGGSFVDQVRRAAWFEMKVGADCIRLVVTGGSSTPGEKTTDVQCTADSNNVAMVMRGGRVIAVLNQR